MNLLKIGMTTRAPEARAQELSSGTGVPSEFFVAYEEEVPNCEVAEQMIHERLAAHRTNERREFFELSLKEAIAVVQEISRDIRSRYRDTTPEIRRVPTEDWQKAALEKLFGPINAKPIPQIRADLLTIGQDYPIGLVYILEGTFVMGSCGDPDQLPGKLLTSVETRYNFASESPEHEVYLRDYWISKHLITIEQYSVFVNDMGIAMPEQPMRGTDFLEEDRPNCPVTKVTWFDTMHFCRWASQITGRKVMLPTEAEWEKAARGTDGRHYPWGNTLPTADHVALVSLGAARPVGLKSPKGDSPYGCTDMVGNVQEWCSSIPLRYPYQENDGRERIGVESVLRAVRGNGISDKLLRCAVRSAGYPHLSDSNRGFRVVVHD